MWPANALASPGALQLLFEKHGAGHCPRVITAGWGVSHSADEAPRPREAKAVPRASHLTLQLRR